MLATKTAACREYAGNVGHNRPLCQWILSDYDTWEPNPFYIGPDQGHPEGGDPLCSVYETFAQASNEARLYAKHNHAIARVEHYKGRCWVVWY